jgi:hypothetical protein
MGQIETAIVASMLAALKVEKEDRSLFKAALETAGEFLQLIKEPQQLRLVHLNRIEAFGWLFTFGRSLSIGLSLDFQFQLRLWERLQQRFDSCLLYLST